VLLLLAGCATSTPDIRLRNPQTGQTFTCSGEAGRTGVKDLETQGYVIIKEPASR